MACVFQRDGHLPYILRRYIHEESGPDPDYTFGHCMVCVQCPVQPLSRLQWVVALCDPAGADYEGDDGVLREDNAEKWHHGICKSISRPTALKPQHTFKAMRTTTPIRSSTRTVLGAA